MFDFRETFMYIFAVCFFWERAFIELQKNVLGIFLLNIGGFVGVLLRKLSWDSWIFYGLMETSDLLFVCRAKINQSEICVFLVQLKLFLWKRYFYDSFNRKFVWCSKKIKNFTAFEIMKSIKSKLYWKKKIIDAMQ